MSDWRLTPQQSPATTEEGIAPGQTAASENNGSGYGPALRERPFILLWLAQICSQTAQNTLNYGLIVEVERLTRSTTSVSLVVASFTIPAVIFGLLGRAITLPVLTLVRPLFEALIPSLAASGPSVLIPRDIAACAGLVGIVALLIGAAFSLVMVPAQTVLIEATAAATIIKGGIILLQTPLIRLMRLRPKKGRCRDSCCTISRLGEVGESLHLTSISGSHNLQSVSL